MSGAICGLAVLPTGGKASIGIRCDEPGKKTGHETTTSNPRAHAGCSSSWPTPRPVAGRSGSPPGACFGPERAAKFREEIRRLRGEGVSYQKIGERLGIATGSIHRLSTIEGVR